MKVLSLVPLKKIILQLIAVLIFLHGCNAGTSDASWAPKGYAKDNLRSPLPVKASTNLQHKRRLDGTLINLALATGGAFATQSSTWGSNLPEKAINGDVTHSASTNCALTGGEPNTWWQVELPSNSANHVYYVDNVVVFNRGDCCSNRLINVYLAFYDAKDRLLSTSAPLTADLIQMVLVKLEGVRKVKVVKGSPSGVDWYLQLCEVQVWGYEAVPTVPRFELSNLALEVAGSVAKQFTTGKNANHAINGVTDHILTDTNCAHTGGEAFQWWEVELPPNSPNHVYHIEKVVVFNRGDCCSNRLINVYLWFYDASEILLSTAGPLTDALAQTIEVSLEGVRRVRAVKGSPSGGDWYLQLCEVQLWGYEVVPTVPRFELSNLALESLKAKATQSSNFDSNSLANKAIDGNERHGPSCSHTSNEANPWWQVELPDPSKDDMYFVDKVVVFNRGDCCSNRLEGVVLEFYDTKGALKKRSSPLNSNLIQTLNSLQLYDVAKVKAVKTSPTPNDVGSWVLSLCAVEVWGYEIPKCYVKTRELLEKTKSAYDDSGVLITDSAQGQTIYDYTKADSQNHVYEASCTKEGGQYVELTYEGQCTDGIQTKRFYVIGHPRCYDISGKCEATNQGLFELYTLDLTADRWGNQLKDQWQCSGQLKRKESSSVSGGTSASDSVCQYESTQITQSGDFISSFVRFQPVFATEKKLVVFTTGKDLVSFNIDPAQLDDFKTKCAAAGGLFREVAGEIGCSKQGMNKIYKPSGLTVCVGSSCGNSTTGKDFGAAVAAQFRLALVNAEVISKDDNKTKCTVTSLSGGASARVIVSLVSASFMAFLLM
jgi:hypothetical protein